MPCVASPSATIRASPTIASNSARSSNPAPAFTLLYRDRPRPQLADDGVVVCRLPGVVSLSLFQWSGRSLCQVLPCTGGGEAQAPSCSHPHPGVVVVVSSLREFA